MCMKLDGQRQDQSPEKQKGVRAVIYHDYFVFLGGEKKKKRKDLNYSYLMGNIAADRLVLVIHWHRQQRTKSNVFLFILYIY